MEENEEMFDNSHIYSIPVKKEMADYLFDFSIMSNKRELNNKIPQMFISKGNNLYLVLHGTESSLFINEEEYDITQINILYKSIVLMLYNMKLINKPVLNLINCSGYYNPEIYDPTGIKIQTPFKVKGDLYVRVFPDDKKFSIRVFNKVEIPEDLIDDIEYEGIMKFETRKED